MVKRLGGQSYFTSNLEGDIQIESDFEGDSMGVESQSRKVGGNEQACAVLVRGSFSACVLPPRI